MKKATCPISVTIKINSSRCQTLRKSGGMCRHCIRWKTDAESTKPAAPGQGR